MGWSKPNAVLSSRISLIVTLGKSPAMNHLSVHAHSCFADSWWGRSRTEPEVSWLKQRWLVRGLVLDFLPCPLYLGCRYILYDKHFARELFVGVDGWGGLEGCNFPLPNTSTACSSLHPLPMLCDLHRDDCFGDCSSGVPARWE